jgi:hypothetical protein
MKALSIQQPWANMIATGEKTIETRTWLTDYRGQILIVSTKKPDIHPAGYALAVATLVDCRPMSVLDEPAAQCRRTPKAIAWVLENVRRIEKPFPVQGELGLFDVDITGLLDLAAADNGT